MIKEAETTDAGTDIIPMVYRDRVMAPTPSASDVMDIQTKDMHTSEMTKMTRNLATKAANFFISLKPYHVAMALTSVNDFLTSSMLLHRFSTDHL